MQQFQPFFTFPNLPMEINHIINSFVQDYVKKMEDVKKKFLAKYSQQAMSSQGKIIIAIGKFLLALRDNDTTERDAIINDLAKEYSKGSNDPNAKEELKQDLEEMCIAMKGIMDDNQRYRAFRELFK
jgi:hypothetical protein